MISRFSSSQTNRLEELLEEEEFGDRKPSEVYRHIGAKAMGELFVGDDVLRDKIKFAI